MRYPTHPVPGQRRDLVPSVRHEFEVGVSDTPHCGCQHAKQSREEDSGPRPFNPEEDAWSHAHVIAMTCPAMRRAG